MVEPFSRLWGYILFIAFFLLGLGMMMTNIEQTMDDAISDKTVKFVDECRTTGRIDPENYTAFANTVYAAGDYVIKIEHKGLKSYPDGSTYKRDYFSYTEKDILPKMFKTTADVDYVMKAGDSLYVQVQHKGRVRSQIIYQMLFNWEPVKTVVANYGGTVGNSLN